LQYEKYPLQIIRPLCYVPEERIILHAQEVGYAGYTCTCNYQDNSARKAARKKLEELTEGDEGKKDRMFAALKNIKFDYLPKSI
jgi:tRNA(Ile)-lysidine synthase TilS/MesJ